MRDIFFFFFFPSKSLKARWKFLPSYSRAVKTLLLFTESTRPCQAIDIGTSFLRFTLAVFFRIRLRARISKLPLKVRFLNSAVAADLWRQLPALSRCFPPFKIRRRLRAATGPFVLHGGFTVSFLCSRFCRGSPAAEPAQIETKSASRVERGWKVNATYLYNRKQNLEKTCAEFAKAKTKCSHYCSAPHLVPIIGRPILRFKFIWRKNITLNNYNIYITLIFYYHHTCVLFIR